MQQVYFDNAATTPLRKEVVKAMVGVLETNYGNASSSYGLGRLSKSIIETARKTISAQLNASTSEIVFTSGGTEADNLILKSAVKDLGVKHIITSKIEHHAVLHTVQQLEKENSVTVHYVNLDSKGFVDYAHLEVLLQQNHHALVSLMHINNEIGNILDLKLVANLCTTYEALFHTDAVQSVGHYKLDLQELRIDFLVASAHKFHGPKGVGFAFIRKNSGLKPLIVGGEQERGLRAGTESVHNVIGMGKAFELAYGNLENESLFISELKGYFINKLKSEIPLVKFNGASESEKNSSYTLLNVCLPLEENKSSILLFQLDLKGIACSKGSACQSGSNKKSHVLLQILGEEELKKSSLRFSFSKFNTKEEVDYVVEALKEFV